MTEVKDIPIDKIRIPEVRVTSYFDPQEHEALKESMREYGQRVPIIVYDVDGELWLSDGYHRLMVAKELGWKTIKAIIYKGDKAMVDIDNLITAAIRGRNNPALFAKVVKRLKDEYGLSWREIARRVGYSPVEVKKYYDLNNLPDQVLELVGSGKLGIGKALLLLHIPDPRAQIQAAEDIVKYNYTEAQTRELVKYYLEAYSEAPPQASAPPVVSPESERLIRCELCDEPMRERATYHWICDECWNAILEAVENAKREAEMSQSQNRPETPT